jgi:hypothetical protein
LFFLCAFALGPRDATMVVVVPGQLELYSQLFYQAAAWHSITRCAAFLSFGPRASPFSYAARHAEPHSLRPWLTILDGFCLPNELNSWTSFRVRRQRDTSFSCLLRGSSAAIVTRCDPFATPGALEATSVLPTAGRAQSRRDGNDARVFLSRQHQHFCQTAAY